MSTQILVGFTKERGTAWLYKQDLESPETNYCTGALTVAQVRRRLFGWHAVELPMHITIPKGRQKGQSVPVAGRKAIVRDDTWQVIGTPSPTYKPQQYDKWLDMISSKWLKGSDLQIGVAGTLKGGAIGWLQLETESNHEACGVEFRPHVLLATSFNGEIATLGKMVSTIVVCDNTRSLTRHGGTPDISLTHDDLHDVLATRAQFRDDFTKEITALSKMKVSDRDFDRYLIKSIPAKSTDSQQAKTRAVNTRDELRRMWQTDVRCAPFRGTAFGVVQTVNTWRQHHKPTRGSRSMLERTMVETFTQANEIADTQTATLIKEIIR